MTTDQFISQQRVKMQKILTGLPIALAAQDTHVKMVSRIFEDGETSKGNQLGYNTTDPLYVNPKTGSPKNFPVKGKNGSDTFKSGKNKGKKHKTGYFESYKDFRNAIGKTNKSINLNLTGILESDFSKGVIKLGDLKYVSMVTNERNKAIVEKFDVYFKLSKEERTFFKERLTDEVLKILR